ncbi:ribosomal protein L4 domain-containing protein [Ampelomyces quisqualis]|uniref:Large ribosomal subunit protein uL4m n=1 Tax=Ampelomyces quisqualis TaxID=50730 RepID=A0A6A5QVI7_AMPQU|nr:ribosomal protein L4 domain-containing protein [Ampelomyces quisqualis]
MACTRFSAPMRGATRQLGSTQMRHMATSASDYLPVKPLSEQTVLATIHRFPSLEPLRFETYPANDLNLPLRRDILHRAVIYEGDMTRLGTASTKTRHEVRGSRRKVRPQKGSGRARLGDRNSPMLRGGGVAFGPKPRDFSTELPKKVYDLAWRTALSHRFRKGHLYIVDNVMELESPSSRLLLDILKYQESLQGRGRNLFITHGERPLLEDALGQLGRGKETLTWQEVDVKNLLEQQRIVIERPALHAILCAHREQLVGDQEQLHPAYTLPKQHHELRNVTGWPEFCALQLSTDPSTDRPAAYESVATRRYNQAVGLPEGPPRSTLMISAYTLLAEAKQLHFQATTGLPWSDFVAEDREAMKAGFPRIQQLTYQQSIKQRLADDASELSRLEADEYERQANELGVKKLQLGLEASLLAAQVYEHEAEALKLQGNDSAATKVLDLAGQLRTEVGDLELEILEARLALAGLDARIHSAKGNRGAWRSAEKEVAVLQTQVDELRAQLEAEAAAEEEARLAAEKEEQKEEEGGDGDVAKEEVKK